MNDTSFIVRAGYNFRVTTYQKVMDWLDAYWPEDDCEDRTISAPRDQAQTAPN